MRSAWLTTSWDDGHVLDLRLAELLTRHGLRATFYVPRSAPTGTMSASQLRELSANFEIGAHTLDHVWLASVSAAEARRQIEQSKDWVEQITGRRCTVFCPPAGRFSREHVTMVGAAGYAGLRSVELLSIDRPQPLENVALMPTTVQVYSHSRLIYAKNMAKRHRWANLWQYIMVGCPDDLERLAESLLRRAIARGGVFHLWGHSWEIEQAGQWQRLESLLHIMQQFSSQAACLTNGQLCADVRQRITDAAPQESPVSGAVEGGM